MNVWVSSSFESGFIHLRNKEAQVVDPALAGAQKDTFNV